jgi:hypothetical protein
MAAVEPLALRNRREDMPAQITTVKAGKMCVVDVAGPTRDDLMAVLRGPATPGWSRAGGWS